MTYRCYYYWLIAPLRGGIEDNPDRQSAFSVNVVLPEGKTYELSLYCDAAGAPQFARVILPDLESERIPQDAVPIIQILQEHLLTSLRLTFRPDAMFAVPAAVWSFFPDAKRHSVKLSIEVTGEAAYNFEGTKAVFVHTFEIRELTRLYVDGADERIPLQYRFLSLYKMLESTFRKHNRWDKSAFTAFLSAYVPRFREMGVPSDPASHLHDLRDRCAHIRTGRGKKREVLGITHLNHAEIVRVEKVFPLLRQLCAQMLNDRLLGKLTITPPKGMSELEAVSQVERRTNSSLDRTLDI